MNHVLYHGECPDGFCAAYAAWRYFKQFEDEVKAGTFPETKFYPMGYEDAIPEMKEGDIAYLLDICFDADTLVDMLAWDIDIEVLDHHKTALPKLEEAKARVPRPPMGAHRLKWTFDLEKSGAMLAWERFFPNHGIPILVRHFQDRDLWQWKIKGSREISAAFRGLPYDFDVWDTIFHLIERFYTFAAAEEDEKITFNQETYEDDCEAYGDLLHSGGVILAYETIQVERLCREVNFLPEFEGYSNIPSVNTQYMISEVGHELLERYPEVEFVVIYYMATDKINVSLRGRGNVDVSILAERNGGGGHFNAAGFEIPYT